MPSSEISSSVDSVVVTLVRAPKPWYQSLNALDYFILSLAALGLGLLVWAKFIRKRPPAGSSYTRAELLELRDAIVRDDA